MQTMNGKTALITGSTDGVGRLVACALGEAGARVFVHGRNGQRGVEVVRAIESQGGRAEFLQADLADLSAVQHLAGEITGRTERLDVLVNNAGIGTGGPDAPRQTNADGHELRFAVNYLAGYALTRRLLPLIKASAPARIVNVASAGQQPLDFDDIMLERNYSGTRAYCQSKLAQILFTVDLAAELAGSGVSVNALHPATYMDTTMVRQSGIEPWSSVEEGAEAILYLVTSPELRNRSGLYFNGLRESRADRQTYDATARQRLRSLSAALTGLPDEVRTRDP